MSDNIPFFDLQVEIMKRLPVKSLIQFRSVSKQWKSLIDSSKFIADYHPQQHRLLVSYVDTQDEFNRKYVSIVDDDSFPQKMSPLTVPVSIQQLRRPPALHNIVGSCSSHGLFCFYNFIDKPLVNIAIIWNPAIRKSVDVVVPNVSNSVLGFGVCPHTNDPKLVKATIANSDSGNGFIDGFWEVEVFTLSSGVWRSPKSSNLPTNMTGLMKYHVAVIDGFIYWCAYDMIMVDGNREYSQLIMSFDLTSEEFTKLYLPDSLLINGLGADLSLYWLRDSLVVLETSYEQEVLLNFDVWMIENGDPKSFTKIFTITTPDASIRRVLGFRKSGETMIQLKREEEHDALSVYERHSKQTNYIGMPGRRFTFYASCYMETLLLLDH